MPFVADLRYALRSFRRTPGLTATLILTIALGIGGNASLFGFIGGLISAEAAAADADAAARLRRVALLLAGASGLVLFLACTTVASLLLGRARARAREMAVRLALGARRWALARLCLADALVVTGVGGGLGVLVGWWTASLFPLLFFADDAEALALSPDRGWLLLAAGVWTAVLLISVTLPVLGVTRQHPSRVLQREAPSAAGSVHRIRRTLIRVQIAIACLLFVSAAAIHDDVQATLRTARGHALGSLSIVPLRLPTSPDGPVSARRYVDTLTGQLGELPWARGMAVVSSLPIGLVPRQSFRAEPAGFRTREITLDVATFDHGRAQPGELTPMAGRHFEFRDGPGACRVAVINASAAAVWFDDDALGREIEAADGTLVEIVGVLPSPADARPALYYHANQVRLDEGRSDQNFYTLPLAPRADVEAGVNVVSDTYFDVFADPPIAGRAFSAEDRPPPCRSALVSDSAAQAWFGGRAVGSALIDPEGERIEIVGVVRASPLAAAQEAVAPLVLLPFRESLQTTMMLAVQSTIPAESPMAADVDRAIDRLAGAQALGPSMRLEEHVVRRSLAAERLTTMLLAVCAAMALVIAAVGIYGAMADLVVRRQRDLALRLALGARAWGLMSQVVGAGLRTAMVGAATGVVAAVVMLPVLGQVIISPSLPSVASVALTTGVIAMLAAGASAMPAWRVMRLDPRDLLQEE